MNDVARIYKMLIPKPKELSVGVHQFIREGEILQWRPKEARTKRKYLFLFNDYLMVSKREGKKRFWLKILITLRKGLTCSLVPDSTYHIPGVEFRIYCPKATFIFFGKNPVHAQSWVRDINYAIALMSGTVPKHAEPQKPKNDDDEQMQRDEELLRRIQSLKVATPSHHVAPGSRPLSGGNDPDFAAIASRKQHAPAPPHGGEGNPFGAPAHEGNPFSGGAGGAGAGASAGGAAPLRSATSLREAAEYTAMMANGLLIDVEQLEPETKKESLLAAANAAKQAVERLQQALEAYKKHPGQATEDALRAQSITSTMEIAKLLGEVESTAFGGVDDFTRERLLYLINTTVNAMEQLSNSGVLSAPASSGGAGHSAAVSAAASSAASHPVEEQKPKLPPRDAAPSDSIGAQLLELTKMIEAAVAELSQAAKKEAAKQQAENPGQAAQKSAGGGTAIDVSNVNNTIYGATASLASLTAQLIHVATEAQNVIWKATEGGSGGKEGVYHKDPAWAQGLISAAKVVAQNIQALIRTANSVVAVKGQSEADELFAVLREVNGAVARLVTSSRSKLDPQSALLPKLSNATSSIKKASGDLETIVLAEVKKANEPAPQQYIAEDTAKGKAAKMEALTEVARLERELEDARKKVGTIQKSEYKNF